MLEASAGSSASAGFDQSRRDTANSASTLLGQRARHRHDELIEEAPVADDRIHIEGPDELQVEWFEGVRRIGLTAGASTPDYSIDQVEQRIRELAPE